MRYMILFAVLAVLLVYTEAGTLQPAVSSRSNLIVGSIRPGDRLLYRNLFYKAPIANAVQSQDIIYRGSTNNRVTAVYVAEVGYTQYANAFITAGGIGYNNVIIRLQSARGYGYYYQVEIWGR